MFSMFGIKNKENLQEKEKKKCIEQEEGVL